MVGFVRSSVLVEEVDQRAEAVEVGAVEGGILMQTQLPLLYLRPRDALEMLPVSRRTLSNWQRRRVIPFYRVGRVILFKPCDIEEALERFCVAAIGEPKRRAARKSAIQV